VQVYMGLGRGPACLGPGSDALVYDPEGGSVVACCDIILVSQRPAKTGDLRG
jgi:hypothetical protein